MMTQTMRWAWVALFAACACAAIWINLHNQRILVLHEGRAEDPATKAFKRGLDARFQSSTNLKVRYQYLGWDPDFCKNILFTLSSFSPHTVIAEGELAGACVAQAPSSPNQRIVKLDSGLPPDTLTRFNHAWLRVLQDLIATNSPVLIIHSAAPEQAQQVVALSAQGTAAGFNMHAHAVRLDGKHGESPLTASIHSLAPAAIIYLPSFASANPNDPARDVQAQLQQLRQLTNVPIFSNRLESLNLGADIALEQAPEQRGEQLAQVALQKTHKADPALPPYEMAVGIRKDFSSQKMNGQLPAFYTLSASMAGFVYDPR